MAKRIRIALLLFVLLTVAVSTCREQARTTSWKRALDVVVFPINADRKPQTADYIRNLSNDSFDSIKQFMREEAQQYGISLLNPVDVHLGPEVVAVPPTPPVGGSVPVVVWWSLQMRYWAWRHGKHPILNPDVRIYALYYHTSTTRRLEHSVGLQKGLIGVAKLFGVSRMEGENNVIITHELLHTLGASDKYNFATNQPIFPVGYAQPDLSPVYPQQFAEIMGGRIPISESDADAPESLEVVLVGPQTALEIGWR